MEHAFLVTDRDDPSPVELKGYFAEIFASLDASPRQLMLVVDVVNTSRSRVAIGFSEGEPVFTVEGRKAVRGSFRGRWLPEHPVPLEFPRMGKAKLVLEPAGGNRVKVRKATFLERLFG